MKIRTAVALSAVSVGCAMAATTPALADTGTCTIGTTQGWARYDSGLGMSGGESTGYSLDGRCSLQASDQPAVSGLSFQFVGGGTVTNAGLCGRNSTWAGDLLLQNGDVFTSSIQFEGGTGRLTLTSGGTVVGGGTLEMADTTATVSSAACLQPSYYAFFGGTFAWRI